MKAQKGGDRLVGRMGLGLSPEKKFLNFEIAPDYSSWKMENIRECQATGLDSFQYSVVPLSAKSRVMFFLK